MLEVKNIEVFGLNRAINAIANSYTVGEIDTTKTPSDRSMKVAKTLGGNKEMHQSHDAYLKGIIVTMDVKYPLYWSPEFQRYHFADIIMSQSTMHSLQKFMDGEVLPFNKYVTDETKALVQKYYTEYVAVKDSGDSQKMYEAFMRLRSNLPSGFEMWETITTNYLQLKTIYVQRHNHKLQEDWGTFCDAILSLPHFSELTGLSK